MDWLKNLAIKLLGKKMTEDGLTKVGLSKAKATAIIYILILGTETISAAFGHPIVVPENVKQFLAAVGLWSIRDAVKS